MTMLVSACVPVANSRAAIAGWTPAVKLLGTAFSAAQIAPGFIGSYDLLRNADRNYLATNTATDSGGCLWSGWVKGTGATLAARASGSPNTLFVSVDGGAYVVAADSSFVHTLFSGLSDAEHYVCIRSGSTSDIYLDETAGNIFNITGGANTYLRMPRDWVYPGVPSSLSVAAGMTKANVANHTPTRTKRGIYSTVSNISAARVRGNFRSLIVASNGTNGFSEVWLSTDGAAPVKYTLPLTPGVGGHAYEITGLSGLHTYTAWTNVVGCVFSVAGDAAHVDIGSKRQIHQFGDSLTNGNTVPGEVEILRMGASMGYAPLTAGISGQNIQELDAAMDTYLAALTVTSDDVAVMAVGRNNIGGAWMAATDTALASCITKLLTKGYGKIICRGVLPTANHSTTYPTESGKIQTAVTNAANAAVVFCDVSACPTFTTVDGTHMDAAGYATVAAFLEPLYRALLGLS